MARQWLVVVPCLLLTLVSTIVIAGRVEPTYNTTGTMLLFFPKLVEDPATGETNSYLSFGNLTVIANVLTEVLNQAAPRQQLVEEGALADFELGLDPTTPTPLITIIATGREADVAPTVNLVMEAIAEELARRQEEAGAPPSTWITVQPVTLPEKAVPQLGSRVRVGATVAGLGLAATISLAFAADSLGQRRAKARLARMVGDDDVPSLSGRVPWSGPQAPSSDEPALSCVVCHQELHSELAYRAHLTKVHGLDVAILPRPEQTASSPGAGGAAG